MNEKTYTQKVLQNEGNNTQSGNIFDFKNANIGIQNNYFFFKLSPLFVKLLNELYIVRERLVRFCTFLSIALCFIGFVVSLYVFKINQGDISFGLIGSFLLSIIVLVSYDFFNKIFYKEFSRFKKHEKIVFLFLIDLIVWGFLVFNF